jgi:hypothetical protein
VEAFMKDKTVKITFGCGHTEEIQVAYVRDIPSFDYCESCHDLYEVNEQKQLKLGLDI